MRSQGGNSASPSLQGEQQNHLEYSKGGGQARLDGWRQALWVEAEEGVGRREDTKAATSLFLLALGSWGPLTSLQEAGMVSRVGLFQPISGPSEWVARLGRAWCASCWVWPGEP